MTTAEFLSRLECVRSRGTRKWLARCPAHPDKTPSLTVSEGERGILIRCFSSCGLQDICTALNITPKDLFFHQLDTDPQQRKAAAQHREAQRRQRERESLKLGRLIDACKAADRYLDSRQPVDISAWSDDRLNRELNLIADAFHILEQDPYAEHC